MTNVSSRRVIGFINVAHVIDHMFMLIFPTAVLGMSADFGRPYAELIVLALGGFIAFGAGSLPAGWLGDRCGRRDMMAIFFLGIGLATLATGLAQTTGQLAAGLLVIGLFASIYHPVGTAMLVAHADRVGYQIGVNGVWGNLGVAFAALVTGAVTQWFGWRWAFVAPGAAAIGVGALYLVLVPREAQSARQAAAGDLGFPRAVVLRALLILGIVALASGLIFNAITVALPKLFQERLPLVAGSTVGIGMFVCAVYLVGAMSQLVIGRVIDRHPLKLGFLPLALLQGPLLLLCAFASGIPLVVAAAGMIFVIFGQVTITDGIVAKYGHGAWRSRIYGLRYLLSFGVSACAVPLVAFMHDTGGFRLLFVVLALCGACVFLGALAFPLRRDELMGSRPVSREAVAAAAAGNKP
jgi:MFS family permease